MTEEQRKTAATYEGPSKQEIPEKVAGSSSATNKRLKAHGNYRKPK